MLDKVERRGKRAQWGGATVVQRKWHKILRLDVTEAKHANARDGD